jgi:Ca2+-binding RTX toxin-like protein
LIFVDDSDERFVTSLSSVKVDFSCPPVFRRWDIEQISDPWRQSDEFGADDAVEAKLDLTGRRAENVWSVITQVAHEFQEHDICYVPLGVEVGGVELPATNSNSFINALLYAVNIDFDGDVIPENPDVTKGLPGSDTLFDFDFELGGTAGRDAIRGFAGDDRFFGMAADDTLIGGGGRDTLYGGNGNDRLDGGSGNDFLFGGNGNDSLSGGLGNDRLDGFDGNDRLLGSSGNDRLYGGNGIDRIDGGSGNDSLSGGAGNDTLAGSTGNDRLYGSDGRDVLTGGNGNDDMTGGTGADRFVFRNAPEADRDLVRDFSAAQNDRIDLRAVDAVAGIAGDQAFAFIGADAFGGTAGELRFVGGRLLGDTDGDRVAELAIRLVGVTALDGGDIQL